MLIINFSHPLTKEHLTQIENITGQKVEKVIAVKTQFDNARPFAEQVEELVKSVGLSPEEWQTRPILIHPPALNFIAVALLAYLHGLMGCFPAIIRLRPVEGSMPPQYEVAEVINLQAVRDDARKQRI
ncbi:MAG: hypothetical protein DRI61_07055 [Chloroflexi bacterium]|nr:MAG: hypothetical protein DRI61_07055 [Chloroflexota bacterium]